MITGPTVYFERSMQHSIFEKITGRSRNYLEGSLKDNWLKDNRIPKLFSGIVNR